MANGISQALESQARACSDLGSPFSAGLLRCALSDYDAGGATVRLLANWAGQPLEQVLRDAVALRLLASLHYLALSGQSPELAACYPPEGWDAERAWGQASEALARFPDTVSIMLGHEPQTNEVRRSACLLGGFLTIAEEAGLPLRCFELGASAGLNSLWDQFRYQIGAQAWGDPQSPVVLECRWDGEAPRLDRPIEVVERQACDRRPIDLRDPQDATRLLSYCWADQQERMARLRAAISLARTAPVTVQAAQASDWVDRAAPIEGAASIVFHSIVWQYIPAAQQQAVLAKLHAHAARATKAAPFYWLRMELEEAPSQFELRLWDGRTGVDRRLALVHPHGAFASWG